MLTKRTKLSLAQFLALMPQGFLRVLLRKYDLSVGGYMGSDWTEALAEIMLVPLSSSCTVFSMRLLERKPICRPEHKLVMDMMNAGQTFFAALNLTITGWKAESSSPLTRRFKAQPP